MPQRAISQEIGRAVEDYRGADRAHHVSNETIDNDERYGPLYESEVGHADKLGITIEEGGCNIAIRAGQAELVDVCIFDQDDPNKTLGRWRLTGQSEDKAGVFHGFIPDMKPGDLYGVRVHGDWDPANHKIYNYNKLLIDPYARAITGTVVSVNPDGGANEAIGEHVDSHGRYWGRNEVDSSPSVPRCVVVDEAYNWGNDRAPDVPRERVVLYEGHVKGMTYLLDEIPEGLRGTYAGMVSEPMLRHLKKLGVTTLELLPIQQSVSEHHLQAKGLVNYWGYNTLGFFAPQGEYSSSGDRGQQVDEFKYMVKKLHDSGIEVVMDVVYNHTPEGSEFGPTVLFKGLNADEMYHYGGDTRHTNYSGTGNTINASSEAGTEFIIDSLRYWVEEMHVDGFRFDLATILARESPHGAINMNNRLMQAIKDDDVLSKVKLYAEPWDCAGYELGAYKDPWGQWNDKFRDVTREFWHGHGEVGALAAKLAGELAVANSVNFVTAHDGLTLNDVVSYNGKHNDANGENNRDGMDNNRSWNFGVEGPTDNQFINELRQRAMRSMILSMMVANGTPMVSHGDEIMRSQEGNNNTYCQDNKTSWLNWDLTDEQRQFLEFTSGAINFRGRHPQFARPLRFDSTPITERTENELVWFRADGKEFLYNDNAWRLQVLGMYMSGIAVRETLGHVTVERDDDSLLYYANGTGQDHEITLPLHEPYSGEYELIIDTATGEILPEGHGRVIEGKTFCVKALSSVILRRLQQDQ